MTTIVKVLRIEDDGTKVFERYSELRDCFPEDDLGYEEARCAIGHVGRFWIGGGAAPLFLLIRPYVPFLMRLKGGAHRELNLTQRKEI